MAIFDIDENMIMDIVSDALEKAGSDMSEDQFQKVVDAIDAGIPGVVETLARGMASFWKFEARYAGGWGSKYAEAIKYKFDGKASEVYIDEEMIDPGSKKPSIMYVEMMEEGVKSWSIKDALMKSDKAKVGPDGIRYITVPFPIATPRKSNQGKMSNDFGKREMTREMHKIVKAGGKLKAGTVSVRGKDVSVAGLTRYSTKQFHSQYGMFRRVSENSKGWVHPGKSATPVFPTVKGEVDTMIGVVMSAFCKNIVKEYSG